MHPNFYFLQLAKGVNLPFLGIKLLPTFGCMSSSGFLALHFVKIQ